MHYLNNNKCFFNIQSKHNTQSHKNCWFDRVIQQRLDRLRPGLSLESSKGELTASNYYPHAPLKTHQFYCTRQNLISYTHPDLSVHKAKTTRVKYPRKGNDQMVFPQANKCVKPKVHKRVKWTLHTGMSLHSYLRSPHLSNVNWNLTECLVFYMATLLPFPIHHVIPIITYSIHKIKVRIKCEMQ